eukprot:42481-Hanusia_phi.AAC.2
MLLQSDILEQVLGGTSFDSKALGDAMKKSSAAAGGFCLLAIFLNLLCAHCSAMLMGYKYTARKTVVFINMTGHGDSHHRVHALYQRGRSEEQLAAVCRRQLRSSSDVLCDHRRICSFQIEICGCWQRRPAAETFGRACCYSTASVSRRSPSSSSPSASSVSSTRRTRLLSSRVSFMVPPPRVLPAPNEPPSYQVALRGRVPGLLHCCGLA